MSAAPEIVRNALKDSGLTHSSSALEIPAQSADGSTRASQTPQPFCTVLIEQFSVLRPTDVGAHQIPVLYAIGLDDEGRSAPIAAAMIADSLEEAWTRLLASLRSAAASDFRMMVCSGPPELRTTAMRYFPRLQWQFPVGAFYGSVMERVPPPDHHRVRPLLKAMHAEPDRLHAESSASATLGTLTAMGLWDAAVQFAQSYQDTLTLYSFPGKLSALLRNSDAYDDLIEGFIREATQTGQFRGCALMRATIAEPEKPKRKLNPVRPRNAKAATLPVVKESPVASKADIVSVSAANEISPAPNAVITSTPADAKSPLERLADVFDATATRKTPLPPKAEVASVAAVKKSSAAPEATVTSVPAEMKSPLERLADVISESAAKRSSPQRKAETAGVAAAKKSSPADEPVVTSVPAEKKSPLERLADVFDATATRKTPLPPKAEVASVAAVKKSSAAPESVVASAPVVKKSPLPRNGDVADLSAVKKSALERLADMTNLSVARKTSLPRQAEEASAPVAKKSPLPREAAVADLSAVKKSVLERLADMKDLSVAKKTLLPRKIDVANVPAVKKSPLAGKAGAASMPAKQKSSPARNDDVTDLSAGMKSPLELLDDVLRVRAAKRTALPAKAGVAIMSAGEKSSPARNTTSGRKSPLPNASRQEQDAAIAPAAERAEVSSATSVAVATTARASDKDDTALPAAPAAIERKVRARPAVASTPIAATIIPPSSTPAFGLGGTADIDFMIDAGTDAAKNRAVDLPPFEDLQPFGEPWTDEEADTVPVDDNDEQNVLQLTRRIDELRHSLATQLHECRNIIDFGPQPDEPEFPADERNGPDDSGRNENSTGSAVDPGHAVPARALTVPVAEEPVSPLSTDEYSASFEGDADYIEDIILVDTDPGAPEQFGVAAPASATPAIAPVVSTAAATVPAPAQTDSRAVSPARPKLVRFVLSAAAALVMNVALVGVTLALLAPRGQSVQESVVSEVVSVIDIVPDATASAAETPRPTSEPEGGAAGAPSPEMLALDAPAPDLPLPSMELAPIPRRDDAPARASRANTTRVAAASTAPPTPVPAEQSSAAAGSAGSGMAGGLGSGSGSGKGRSKPLAAPSLDVAAAPTHREPPEYPPKALNAGIEGVVTLEFGITETGKVRDPQIVEAVPAGVFDQAALKAIANWRYSPKLIAGEPVARRARQSMLFSLKR